MELLLKGGDQRMSSKEIAELTGKRHDHVLRDCDKLNANYLEMKLPIIGVIDNQHPTNGTFIREMLLTKEQTFDLMTGYNTQLRIKVNRRWAELEAKEQSKLPATFAEALRLAADQAEQLELQAPKVNYYEEVLTSKSTYKTTQIAEELGMSAIKFNRMLKDLKVQRKVNNQWILLAKYKGLGYTKSTTHTYTSRDAGTHSTQLTEWTEEGRKFIHELIR